jgi:hypothetical protein
MIEKALRETGLSARQAKKLFSAGWQAVVGEEQAHLELEKMRLEEESARLADEAAQLKDVATFLERFSENVYNSR